MGASWPPGYTEETHTFPQPGIRRLKITAPPGPPLVNSTSKMFVEVYFAPDTTCPPTGDVLLNAPSILAEFKRALDSTMMDAGRKERGGVLFRDDNSQPPSFQVLPLTAANFPGYLSTDCEFAVGLVSQSGFTQLATYHTRGRAAGRANPILQCAARQGYTAALGPSQCSVGQSCDFKVADALQHPVYVIDQDFVFRIQPNMHGAQTGDSEARWLWKSLNGKACLEPG